MKKKSIGLVVVLLLLVFYTACSSTKSVAKRITIENHEIPPDMKTEDFVLIGILRGERNIDKYVEREFSKYTGKYILSLKVDLNSKYSDTDKYRYYMDFNLVRVEKYNSVLSARYFIYDRKKKREYARKFGSSFFALEMRAYLMAIESIRYKEWLLFVEFNFRI